MSALRAIWEPAAPAQRKTKGFLKKIEMDRVLQDRERSPRRRSGLKALLKSWAMGECSTAGMWRVCHAVAIEDNSDVGCGLARIAQLGSQSSGSAQNCSRQMQLLLDTTSLPTMIQEVPHVNGEDTVTHTLPPTEVIRLIHSHNRLKFGQIFSADTVRLKEFWRSLFSSDDGREFKQLHPVFRNVSPEDLQSSIPIVIHEDAAPYGKKRSVNVI